MTPKISIIVTSYNIEKYIGECLNNITKQTLKDIEIIVVDDASTDKTCDVIREFSKTDPRIKPIFMEVNSPGGVATPANIGMKQATGQFIGFADGDDLYDPTMFEKLYNSAIRYNSEISLCNFMEFENETEIRNIPFDPGWNTIAINEELTITEPGQKFPVLDLLPVPWRKIYKRSFLLENNLEFPVGPYFFEDNGFHWFTTICASKITFVNEVLCYHRRNRVGQTMASGGERLLGVFHQHEVIYNYLQKNKLLAQYKYKSLKWLMAHLSWVDHTLDPKFSNEFYEVMVKHFKNYTKEDIRNAVNREKYARKTIELTVCLISKNKNKFIQVMHGKTSNNIIEKIAFNFGKLGVNDFSKMVMRYAFHTTVHKYKQRNTKSSVIFDDSTFRAVEALRHEQHQLNKKIDQLNKLIELNLILNKKDR